MGRAPGVERRLDGEAFLREFVDRAEKYRQVVQGLLYRLTEAAAEKESVAFTRTPEMVAAITAYESHAAQHLSEKHSGPGGRITGDASAKR